MTFKDYTQKATVSSTCWLWSQGPGPMASEAEPASGAPQGRKASTLRPTRVLKEALVLRGERRKVPSAFFALSQPQMVCYTSSSSSHAPLPNLTSFPPPSINSTPGRWLQILQGPLSIPLAESHIPEQHMFHLKPARFALPSGAKEKSLAQAAHFLGELGVGRGRWGGRSCLC